MDENRGEQMSLTPTAPRSSDLKRRGLFAMGAALLGAAAAKLAGPAPTVEAAAGGNFILGQANDAGTAATSLTATIAANNTLDLTNTTNDGNALVGHNTGNGGGLVGSVSGTGTALAGVSQQGIGLSGTSFATTGGVFAGVSGFSQIGVGVLGGTAANTAASPPQTGVGVLGQGGANATGVQGTSVGGIGILGVSTSGVAGQFNGPVITNGNLTVNGTFTATGIKSAAVPSGDGLVRLYCLESPESYFEDFGSGQIVNGVGTVKLDAGFAAVVDVSSAKIFLTEYGDFGGLYVSGQSASGDSFSIGAHIGGSGGFVYRIVAKRKDVEGTAQRLQDVPVTKGTTNFIEPALVKTPDALPGVKNAPGPR